MGKRLLSISVLALIASMYITPENRVRDANGMIACCVDTSNDACKVLNGSIAIFLVAFIGLCILIYFVTNKHN